MAMYLKNWWCHFIKPLLFCEAAKKVCNDFPLERRNKNNSKTWNNSTRFSASRGMDGQEEEHKEEKIGISEERALSGGLSSPWNFLWKSWPHTTSGHGRIVENLGASRFRARLQVKIWSPSPAWKSGFGAGPSRRRSISKEHRDSGNAESFTTCWDSQSKPKNLD